jgi:hypothetical protein
MIVVPAAIPFTTPDVPTEAMAGMLLLHVPPEPEVDNVITELIHTEVEPEIVPETGSGLTVMIFDVETEPHVPNTVYDTLAVPAMLPATTPEPSTVATDGMLLDHEPPDIPSVREIVEPAQTDEVPVMAPAVDNALTVTSCVATDVPQLLDTL